MEINDKVERLNINLSEDIDRNLQSQENLDNINSFNEQIYLSKLSKEADPLSNKLKFKKPTLLNNLFPDIIDSNTNDLINTRKKFKKSSDNFIRSKINNNNDNFLSNSQNKNEYSHDLQEIHIEDDFITDNLRLNKIYSQQEMSEDPCNLYKLDNIVRFI